MKFSVIIPVYKVEKYLNACVDSVLHQSFQDFEVILVDDGSPDSCPDICDNYARDDRRVRVIHQKNAGLAAARNSGTKVANGEYICYIDSDDYLSNNNVFQLLADKTFDSPDIINYKFQEWYEIDGHISDCKFQYNVPTEGRSLSQIYCSLIDKDAYYNSAWSKIIKRSLLVANNISFEEGLLGEDNEWYYHVVMSASTVKLIDEPLYIYRRRQGSITTTTSRKNLVDQIYVLDKWEKLLCNYEHDSRSNVVWGSLAKQYCSALIIYSGLKDSDDLMPKLIEKSYMLRYSNNPRVVTFRRVKTFLGLKGVIFALKIVNLLKK